MTRAAEESRALWEAKKLIVAKVFDVTASSFHRHQQNQMPELVDELGRRPATACCTVPCSRRHSGNQPQGPYH